MKRQVFLPLFLLLLFAGIQTVWGEEIRVGLEKNFKNRAEIAVEDTSFKLSAGSKEYDMALGSTLFKPFDKVYYDTGLKFDTYSEAEKARVRFTGSSCIPVLKNEGWGIYLNLGAKCDTSAMTKITTGGNCVVCSVNGVNRYLVDASYSARVRTADDRVDLGKGEYRGVIAFYRDNGGLTAINMIDAEKYLYGTVGMEMSPAWHIEALKAQSVAARTYAYAAHESHKHGVYDLCDTTHCQNYGGIAKEEPTVIQAVNATEGEKIYYEDELINAVYFSSSGGSTMECEDVWYEDIPYLSSVPDIFEKETDNWSETFTKEHIAAIVKQKGFDIGKIKDINCEYLENGRVKAIVITGEKGEAKIEKESVRTAFTAVGNMLNSVNFKLNKNEDGTYTLTGKGKGHGVGMSQYGAKGMAESGFSYLDILKHYYSGTQIRS